MIMAEEAEFEFFSGNDSPFSLQYPATFTIDDRQFLSVEHYITYQQAVVSEDKVCAEKILSAKDHEKLKECGRRIQNFKMQAWQDSMKDVLISAIEAKFDQNPELHDSLLATHPKLLVEATPGNKTWGIGLASDDVRALDKNTWKGDNLLGYAMTRLRDKLMAHERKHGGRTKKHVAPEKEGEAKADQKDPEGKTGKKKKKKKKIRIEEEGTAVEERQREGGVGEEEVKNKRKWLNEKPDQNNKKRENEQMDPTGKRDSDPRGGMGPRMTCDSTPTDLKATYGNQLTTGYRDYKHEGLSGEDKLYLFYGYKSPFSHHHEATFTIDGRTFNCAEQYMMYQKAVTFEDKKIEEAVMATYSPAEQKRLGRQIVNFDIKVWKQCCQRVVERANLAKFSQNPYLKRKLLKTHPKLMVEASPSDLVWGIGLARDDPLAWDQKNWRGKNQLGYILTKVRDMIMEQEKS
ncbi:uncharacterized protein [Haliotis cracherodii]|uniref:uncharacterized protein n=1 Tax=Haliotis cracherodii TaxID=6455 RepID=UPI0039EB29A4